MTIVDGTNQNTSDKILTNVSEKSVDSIFMPRTGTNLQTKDRHTTENSDHYTHRHENLEVSYT
jgi:hypothetical protein